MQFCWNLQLLTRYSFLKNLPCSTTNLLTVDVDWMSVAFFVCAFGVTFTIALDILNNLWRNIACLLHKLNFIVFMATFCILLSHFLVVEDFELPKSTVLIHLFSFYFKCLPQDVLCKFWCYLCCWYYPQLIMWKNIDLSQQVVICPNWVVIWS